MVLFIFCNRIQEKALLEDHIVYVVIQSSAFLSLAASRQCRNDESHRHEIKCRQVTK